MGQELEGRQVVVTGGSGALGDAVVQAMVEAGATCHVPVRDAEGLSRVSLARNSAVSVAVGVDLIDEQAVRSFYAELPGLWASIHCAGGFAMAALGETSGDDLRAMLRANLLTCFHCCREAATRIRASGDGGRIVNVASRQALEPRSGAGMSAYTAAKSAVSGLTVALAEELVPERIWVNAVVPSILDTAHNREAMPEADPSGWPKVEEVARAIAFLASPRNRSVRGALVPVYGGS